MRTEGNNVRILNCSLNAKEATEMFSTKAGYNMIYVLNKIILASVRGIDFRRAMVELED